MGSKNGHIVVRIPPSPTGPFHVGNTRTALYNYLFAKQHGGKFVLRIEDTDLKRSKREFEEDIKSGLNWLGLHNDGEVLRQSERTEIYKKKIQELIAAGKAYISHETEGENKEVVRFKNPGGEVTFQDLVRGEVTMDVSDLKDFIIARNINEPIYHLTVVVDDMESGVTHVMRGEDHISNTPRQILILEALGGTRPVYAHIPLVLAEDRSKLSKRKHGDKVSLKYYINEGYLPVAILNFLALIGWNPGTEQEIFTLEELIKEFDITKVQKAGAIFNVEKLNWVNKEHLKKLPLAEIDRNIMAELPKELQIPKLIPLIFERISKWSDIKKMVESGELDFFFKTPSIDKTKITYKGANLDDTKKSLELAHKTLESIEDFSMENVKNNLMLVASNLKSRGELLHPVRYALSGLERSPDPFIIASILGKRETLQRLSNAI